MTVADVFPIGWTKTTADLFAESKELGTAVGPPQTEWALAYERHLLRSWARFPNDGEVYEALEDNSVTVLTDWAAPYTGGCDGVLPKSTKVRVSVVSFNLEPVAVYAFPLNSKEIEALLVSEADRCNEKYRGYHLSVSTADLNRRYRLIV
jgi:hypothetical protein